MVAKVKKSACSSQVEQHEQTSLGLSRLNALLDNSVSSIFLFYFHVPLPSLFDQWTQLQPCPEVPLTTAPALPPLLPLTNDASHEPHLTPLPTPLKISSINKRGMVGAARLSALLYLSVFPPKPSHSPFLTAPASVWFLSARVASNRFPQLPCIINAYCSPRWQWQIGSKIHWLAVNVLFSHAWASSSPYCCQLEDFSPFFPSSRSPSFFLSTFSPRLRRSAERKLTTEGSKANMPLWKSSQEFDVSCRECSRKIS